METPFAQALLKGFERIAAWADLLDAINVFPVADGDTGRNLVVSLSPFRRTYGDREQLARELLLSARGNAGNIAARFFSGLLTAGSKGELARAVRMGRDLAWQAVKHPRHGTMLTVLDELAAGLEEEPATFDGPWRERMMGRLEGAVLATPDLLPKLKAAGVIDAGALGLFIFLDGFFSVLSGDGKGFRPIAETFRGCLCVSPAFSETGESGCCVDTVIRLEDGAQDGLPELDGVGESVVVIREGDYLKVHLHAHDDRKARGDLAAFGKVVRWCADDLGKQIRSFRRRPEEQAVHVMTDAAGSLSRGTAAEWGMTLLDSYINVGERSLPETLLAPEDLYAAMRSGIRVSTAQASLFERHERFRAVLDRYPRVLYLCVGSAFTGNWEDALSWQERHDPEGRFTVIDSGAASGRLGLMALAAARYACGGRDAAEVVRFIREGMARCREYVFLDTLKYLAAGGRMGRAKALFGDMLRMKPVISPLAEGVRRMGTVRNRTEQKAFALERLAADLKGSGRGIVMVEYTDNREWVERAAQTEIARRWPQAEIILQPMSLTAGAHMGPGTWAVACLPERS